MKINLPHKWKPVRQEVNQRITYVSQPKSRTFSPSDFAGTLKSLFNLKNIHVDGWSFKQEQVELETQE